MSGNLYSKLETPSGLGLAVKTMIVLGSGGHTAEMLGLLSALDFSRFTPRTYVRGQSDTTSMPRIENLEAARGTGSYQVAVIKRSREVHQSWRSAVVASIIAIVDSLVLVIGQGPEVIVCNGPGTCVPLCLAAFILKAMWMSKVTVVFVESLCRVHSLSLTARILLHVADVFVVQWPQVHRKYPKTIHLGRLI